MIVYWPIIIVVVPLLESELNIDPCSVKVCDKVINVVRLWGFLFLLAMLLEQSWGEQSRWLLSSALSIWGLRPQICTTLAAPKLGLLPNCLGVVVVAAPVFSGQKVQSESTDAGLLEIGENWGQGEIQTKIWCSFFHHHEHTVVCTLLLVMTPID